jgi:hypothetical protein
MFSSRVRTLAPTPSEVSVRLTLQERERIFLARCRRSFQLKQSSKADSHEALATQRPCADAR